MEKKKNKNKTEKKKSWNHMGLLCLPGSSFLPFSIVSPWWSSSSSTTTVEFHHLSPSFSLFFPLNFSQNLSMADDKVKFWHFLYFLIIVKRKRKNTGFFPKFLEVFVRLRLFQLVEKQGGANFNFFVNFCFFMGKEVISAKFWFSFLRS